MKKGVTFSLLVISVLILSISLVIAESNETEVINETKVSDETETTNETEEPETCATSIGIDFNRDVYSEGEFLEMTTEIFDSDGSRIPFYVFYTEMYYENMWHEPFSQKTDADGYFKKGGTAIRPSDEIIKVKFKVYTQETSSCSSVEDIIEIEYTPKKEAKEEQETGSESVPTTCASRIEINFDKTSYTPGDTFNVEVGVFDSQENSIPNYPFYVRMYDNMWHSADFKTTGSDGYFKDSGEIPTKTIKDVTKGIFHAYTKEIGSCGMVEDTIELYLEESEPEPCGIGTCVPKEELEEPEEIPKDEVFYKCNGCELEDKCYPIGYRKKEKYCSENYEFINQIDGECENNFECESNICISGECVEEGLMKRIIKWFKRLFGVKSEPKEPGLEMCSELLIEENIGGYEYDQSSYGDFKEAQAPLISDEGEQIGTIKCCVAQYLDENEKRSMALVCPYENREYVENLVTIGLEQASEGGANFILEDYKGESVYVDKWVSMVWAHENYAVASGTDYEEEGHVFPEEIADAYLDKYPNDLEEILQ